jgi:hypothetical protein
MEHAITYRLCEKLAMASPAWYQNTKHDRPLNQMARERLAYRLFQSTSRADLGATKYAHGRDMDRMALFERLLRSDMTPASALEYIESL